MTRLGARGRTLLHQGEYAEAEALCRGALYEQRRTVGIDGTIKKPNRAGNSQDASLENETQIAACWQAQVFCKMQLATTADEIQLLFANFQVREGLHPTGGALSPRMRSRMHTRTHTHTEPILSRKYKWLQHAHTKSQLQNA